MVTGNKRRIKVGSEANQSRKKRGAKEVEEEVDQVNTTKKKQKLDRELSLYSQCYKVLESMRDKWFGWYFEELDVENNPDYFSVISKPMDFVTIKSKLAKNLYVNTVDEFPEDVRLVFANTVRYYPPDDPLHKNAQKLMKIFELRWESVKKKLACGFSRIEVGQSRPKTSSYVGQKVSLSTNPDEKELSKKDKPDSKSDQDSMLLSPSKVLRAATMKIRFADTIVRAKFKNLIDESTNKADVKMKMQKAKQLLQTRQREVKAKIEAETRAARLKVVLEERLAREKWEEEVKSKIEDRLETEKELEKLCGEGGGSYLARTQKMEELGLFLRIEDYWPELEEIYEEGEIS